MPMGDAEMKILLAGDYHLSDRTPKFRKDNYKETGFVEMGMIREKSSELKVDAVIFTGDIFDDKAATRNSHTLVREAIYNFSLFPCPVYSIIGNHDISYNRIETLEKQPLGVVFESRALKKLDRITIKGVDIVGIHFSEENTYDVLYSNKIEGRPLIAVCHVLATLEGGDFFGEPIFSYEQLAQHGNVDCYGFGHFHNDQGIQVVKGKHFLNLGAIARGALNKDNIHRQVKLGLIEHNGKEFKCSEIILPVRPASEIFDMERKQEIDENENQIEAFVKSLTANELFESLENLEDNIRGMRLESKVENRLCQYLNLRGANINV